MTLEAIILAAGKGARMNSNKPKVLHSIGGIPMLEHVVDAAMLLEATKVDVVVGYGAGQIKAAFSAEKYKDKIFWVTQEEQLGTGHAVRQALPNLQYKGTDDLIIVLYGDVPLTKLTTLRELVRLAGNNKLCMLSLVVENPTGLGRILRNQAGNIEAIVEEKDATEAQRQIKEINSGIMVAPKSKLINWLGKIGNSNQQGEYYLTDIVALAAIDGTEITGLAINDGMEVLGVNDKGQLAALERHYQMTKTTELLQSGVTLRDPNRVDVRGSLSCGKDVEIDVNTIFEGDVVLGDEVVIGANSTIKDSSIGSGTKILTGTSIDGATVGSNASVGPMARIRPGTVLKDETKIGNFVETKNAIIGAGSKASHLAYIGDAELGESVNIGAGVIVCNYDGVNKHRTIIGNNVFVGSNSVLVAPVTLSDNAFIAAGSSINGDVPADNLAVGRAKQRNIPGWKRPIKK